MFFFLHYISTIKIERNFFGFIVISYKAFDVNNFFGKNQFRNQVL